MYSRRTLIIYLSVLFVLVITTLMALYDGGYHTDTPVIVGVAIGSLVLSLIPFFVSRLLLKKYESGSGTESHYLVWGVIVFLFCFPVKLVVIYTNISLLINGGSGWAFG
jgi:xanthine/uracil permease